MKVNNLFILQLIIYVFPIMLTNAFRITHKYWACKSISFEHLIIIFWGSMEQKLNVEWCYVRLL